MLANIIRNRKKTAIGGGGGGIVIDNGDPFYSAVSMLLPMDGTNGSTTFTDSGPNAITVTAVGNAQVSTTQSKHGGASGYFDGNGDYLSLGTQSQLDFGTGDFTVECWFQLTSTTNADQGILNDTRATFGTGSVLFKARQASGSGKICFQAYDFSSVGGRIVQSTTVPVVNTWYHVALVRSSGTVRLFVNGVLESSGTWAGSVNFNYNNGTRIGHSILDGANGHFTGYLDDLRISRFARYVSNFTPPTAALPTTASSTPADPYYGYNSILLHMDGSSGSTAFVDSGPSALTVTASGDAKVSTGSPYFGTGAAIFDGSGDFLSVPSGTSVNFGTGDFTVEMWARYSFLGFLNNALVSSIGPTVGGLYFAIKSNLTFLVARAFVANDLITAAVTWPANTWAHIALSRSGSTMRVFKDGVLVSSVTSTQSYSLALSGNNDFAVGATQSTSGVRSQTDFFNGQIDDLRITKYARYTSAFAPPTQAHLEYANGNDRHFSNVSLLLHMDGANGSTTFTDNSANALAVTAVGNAQISTAQSQFGGASAYFDGATGYLSLTGNSSFQFGTGDFTVEIWVYISANAANQQTFLDIRGSATATPFTFGIYQSKLLFYDGAVRQSSATITTGQWYHFAACRSSGTLRLFIDGISYYSASSSTNFTTGANSIYIGRGFDAAAYYTNGFIDDLRVSRFARYVSNFTPPTQAHPNA